MVNFLITQRCHVAAPVQSKAENLHLSQGAAGSLGFRVALNLNDFNLTMMKNKHT